MEYISGAAQIMHELGRFSYTKRNSLQTHSANLNLHSERAIDKVIGERKIMGPLEHGGFFREKKRNLILLGGGVGVCEKFVRPGNIFKGCSKGPFVSILCVSS